MAKIPVNFNVFNYGPNIANDFFRGSPEQPTLLQQQHWAIQQIKQIFPLD